MGQSKSWQIENSSREGRRRKKRGGWFLKKDKNIKTDKGWEYGNGTKKNGPIIKW